MTKVNELSQAIADALGQYKNLLDRDIEDASDSTTKKTVSELKGTSPRSTLQHKHYAASWTRKKTRNGYIVYNTKYQLTHLLEKGHAKVGGGRTRAIPHIRPAEILAVGEFEKLITKAARGK